MKKNTKKIISFFIILLFLIGIFFSIYFFYYKGYSLEKILSFFPQNIYIISAIFLLIFSLRIFIFIPSTIIIITFGLITNNFFLTFILSVIGIAIGLTQTYYIGYLLEEDLEGNKLIKKIKPQIKKIKKDGFKYIFLGCLAPFFPTDLICYASGFIKYNYKKFLLAGMLGELPLIFLYSFIGINAKKYIELTGYIFLVILILYIFYKLFFKKKK